MAVESFFRPSACGTPAFNSTAAVSVNSPSGHRIVFVIIIHFGIFPPVRKSKPNMRAGGQTRVRKEREPGMMLRQLRVEYEGAIYHVMSPGDRREPIFVDDADRELF